MDMGQEENAMPLGAQQYNNFTQFTMDVWNDKMFYQEKEFPAGFMATSILNIPDEKLPELLKAAGALSFLFPEVIRSSDEEAARVFPQLREQIIHLTELLWKYPPFCYNDYEEELCRINELFDVNAFSQIRTPYSPFQITSMGQGNSLSWPICGVWESETRHISPWPRMTASKVSNFGT